MDYTKFLGKKDEVVLAYLGGAYAVGKDRQVRVDGERPSIGFHRFEIKGRAARALGAVDVPLDEFEKNKLPKVRGHHVRGWVTVSGLRDNERVAGLSRVVLMPEEEPAPFAILRARRWYSGDLVFESIDFDTDVEDAARLRLEKLEGLGEMKGVPASLRLAYSAALTMTVAQRMNVALSVREAAAAGPRIADVGEPAAREFVASVNQRRLEADERARVRALMSGKPLPPMSDGRKRQHREAPTLDNAHIRAEIALDGAHARLLSTRNLAGGNLEVTFEYLGERFISVVDAISLHVYDSGVCLAGADELVTLDSLPAVIREAIDTDRLVITRR
jgi:hypothetical protein